MTIAQLVANPGPFNLARFRAFGHLCQSELAQDLVVVAGYSQQRKYLWGEIGDDPSFRLVKFHCDQERELFFGRAAAIRAVSYLEELKPLAVFAVGYRIRFMREAARWSRRQGAVSVQLNDTWKGDKPRYWPVELYKGWLCRSLYDGMFLGGSRQVEYYAGLRFPSGRMWRGYDVVDNKHFRELSGEARRLADDWRARLSLPKEYFLCVARFSREKNIPRLIAAFNRYQERGGTWSLVLVGEGPQREAMERSTAGNPKILIYPWQAYETIPVFYALASCLVLPSVSETWGLVVNEAMACGLPVAVSQKCGCQPELCWRGINGYDFSPYNVEDIADAMLYFARKDAGELREMGIASSAIIDRFTPEIAATAQMDCLRTLLENRA